MTARALRGTSTPAKKLCGSNDAADEIVGKSAEVAAFAEMWSSYAQGFKYHRAKCEL